MTTSRARPARTRPPGAHRRRRGGSPEFPSPRWPPGYWDWRDGADDAFLLVANAAGVSRAFRLTYIRLGHTHPHRATPRWLRHFTRQLP